MRFSNIKEEALKYFNGRIKYALLFLFIFVFILIARLCYLQIYKYDYFLRLSENNRIRDRVITPDRGFIKDRNGVILVRNSPSYELHIIKGDVKNLKELLDDIEKIIPIDRDSILKRYKEAYIYQSVRVSRGLTEEHVAYFMEHMSDFPGLDFEITQTRSYLDNFNFTHLLGYMQEISENELKYLNSNNDYRRGDFIGKAGLEKQYEHILRGDKGSARVEVDSFVQVVEVLNEVPAKPGRNLILSLDSDLQDYANSLLKDRTGSVVILDGKDNSVLTIASAPSYDVSVFSPFISSSNWDALINDPRKPLLNRAIDGAYPPGSVIKIVMALAGLMEGVVNEHSTFHCNGSFKTSPKSSIVYRCWKKGGHGEVNLRKSLKVSCDVFYYNLGMNLGIDLIDKYASIFSIGKRTGIDLPNEKSGILPSRTWKSKTYSGSDGVWLPGDTVNSSIGQGYMTVTPLQIAVMTSSIFNGGKVYVPRLVRFFEDPITGVKEETPLEISSQLNIPKAYLDLIMDGLVAAVDEVGGTSRRGAVKGLKYGGKTGTAQVVSLRVVEGLEKSKIPDRWKDHSWYTGIYPASKPRYTVVVMLENSGSGGASAAPMGSLIISKMLELGYYD